MVRLIVLALIGAVVGIFLLNVLRSYAGDAPVAIIWIAIVITVIVVVVHKDLNRDPSTDPTEYPTRAQSARMLRTINQLEGCSC